MNVQPSFDDVFDRECGYVVHSLRRLGVREADLEDLAQDVFVAVHRRFETYDRSRPLRPWLFAFAYRTASNYRRLTRVRRETVLEEPAADVGVPADQEDRVQQERRRRWLHRALQTLDPKHRAAVILVDLDGVSPKHAAETFGIPLDTLYSRVRNGRSKLRAALEESARPEPSQPKVEGANHG